MFATHATLSVFSNKTFPGLLELVRFLLVLHLTVSTVIMYYNNAIVHCVPFSFRSLMHISYAVVDSLIPVMMNTSDGPLWHRDHQDNEQSWLTLSQGLTFSSFRCMFPLGERVCVCEQQCVFVTDNLSLEVESVMTCRIIHF